MMALSLLNITTASPTAPAAPPGVVPAEGAFDLLLPIANPADPRHEPAPPGKEIGKEVPVDPTPSPNPLAWLTPTTPLPVTPVAAKSPSPSIEESDPSVPQPMVQSADPSPPTIASPPPEIPTDKPLALAKIDRPIVRRVSSETAGQGADLVSLTKPARQVAKRPATVGQDNAPTLPKTGEQPATIPATARQATPPTPRSARVAVTTSNVSFAPVTPASPERATAISSPVAPITPAPTPLAVTETAPVTVPIELRPVPTQANVASALPHSIPTKAAELSVAQRLLPTLTVEEPAQPLGETPALPLPHPTLAVDNPVPPRAIPTLARGISVAPQPLRTPADETSVSPLSLTVAIPPALSAALPLSGVVPVTSIQPPFVQAPPVQSPTVVITATTVKSSDATSPGTMPDLPHPVSRTAPSTAIDAQSSAVVQMPTTPRIAPAAQVFAEAIKRAARDHPRPATPEAIGFAATSDIKTHAVVATTDTQHAPLDLRQEQWPTRMIERIDALRDAANANDTNIRLIPDALGKIDVSLKRDGDTVTVNFTAQQPETRQLLTEAAPKLAELAEARGLKLAQGGTDFTGQQQQRQQPTAPSTTAAPRSARAADTESTDTRIA